MTNITGSCAFIPGVCEWNRAMPPIADVTGYIASGLVLLTFMTKDMRHLRVMAILSNVAFIVYGYLNWLSPVLCLHLFLLPLNVFRLTEILLYANRRRSVGVREESG